MRLGGRLVGGSGGLGGDQVPHVGVDVVEVGVVVVVVVVAMVVVNVVRRHQTVQPMGATGPESHASTKLNYLAY